MNDLPVRTVLPTIPREHVRPVDAATLTRVRDRLSEWIGREDPFAGRSVIDIEAWHAREATR